MNGSSSATDARVYSSSKVHTVCEGLVLQWLLQQVLPTSLLPCPSCLLPCPSCHAHAAPRFRRLMQQAAAAGLWLQQLSTMQASSLPALQEEVPFTSILQLLQYLPAPDIAGDPLLEIRCAWLVSLS